MLELKDKMPEFSLEGSDGKTYTNKDFEGKYTVIYFYPKDNTPGCTAQACSIRDHYAEITKRGINLVGISPDSIEKHDKFIEKHDLNFTLLADPDHKVAEAFGTWGEKNLYGKISIGLKRTTFIFDKNGEVIKVMKRVKTKSHGQELLDFFDKYGA